MAKRTTIVLGEEVELPETLAEIMADVRPHEVADFMADVWHTPLDQLERRMLLGWAIGPAGRDADEAVARRVRAGDFSGFSGIDGESVG
ncbi:hypothetical protein [Embleya sp. AB8]|uniref:hypothetical protein n=1 Tax=Embleya sp. AB8 TaxID=3156304 RepID=UPI003C775F48